MTYAIKNPILRFVYWVAEIRQCAQRALTESRAKRYRPEQHYMRGPGPKYRAANKDSMGSSTTNVNGKPNSK